MESKDLLIIYKTIIRPFVEYSSVVYHSLIPNYIAEKLERVQKQAIKIIYGWNVDYDQMIENGTIETLRSRRESTLLKFALKAEASPRFGPVWFKPSHDINRAIRATTRNKYLEPQYRTDRDKNNPISVLTRCLNEHYKNGDS